MLNVRREDERKVLEEEEKIRSNVLKVLSEKEFSRHLNVEDEVKRMKIESRSWIKPEDLTKEIERMLNEKHGYNNLDRSQWNKTNLERNRNSTTRSTQSCDTFTVRFRTKNCSKKTTWSFEIRRINFSFCLPLEK